MATEPTSAPHRPGAAFWVSAAIGAAIIAFGVRGILVEERGGAPSAARWAVGTALALDLVLVPVGAAIAWVVHRLVPPWSWPAVRAGLLTTAVLVAFALPLVLDQGGSPANPTVRPRDYEAGLTGAVALTWTFVAAWTVAAAARRRRTWQHAPDVDRGGRPDR